MTKIGEENHVTSVVDGHLYDAAHDETLFHKRTEAKTLCFKFNQTTPDNLDQRNNLLQQILGKSGKNICIEQPFCCDYGSNITVGDNFYANHNLIILDCARVTIGNDVIVAPNVGIHTAGHPLDVDRRRRGLEFALPVTIGNNVWIGASVVILPGVSIGDNSVIGAGSVVTKDVPANVIAVGNPCKVLREIKDQDAERQNFTK